MVAEPPPEEFRKFNIDLMSGPGACRQAPEEVRDEQSLAGSLRNAIEDSWPRSPVIDGTRAADAPARARDGQEGPRPALGTLEARSRQFRGQKARRTDLLAAISGAFKRSGGTGHVDSRRRSDRYIDYPAMSDVLAPLPPADVAGFYRRLAADVKRRSPDGRSLASELLLHWLDGRGAQKIIDPNYLKDVSFVRDYQREKVRPVLAHPEEGRSEAQPQVGRDRASNCSSTGLLQLAWSGDRWPLPDDVRRTAR